MARPKILLADLDEAYLLSLEGYFVEEFVHSADLHVITDAAYLHEQFTQPQAYDAVVIHEALFQALQESEIFPAHRLGSVFVLCEELGLSPSSGGMPIYKYGAAKDILQTVMAEAGLAGHGTANKQKAKIIMVYSPVGGCGQTVVAAALAAALKGLGGRAVYVNGDSLQATVEGFSNGACLPAGLEQSLIARSAYCYLKVQPLLVTSLYDAVPPFPAPLPSLGLGIEDIFFLCEAIRDSDEFEYVVLDASKDFTKGVSNCMERSDHVILITNRDGTPTGKMGALLQSIDTSDATRYLTVCNKYTMGKQFQHPGTEALPQDDSQTLHVIGLLAESAGMLKLAQFFM